MTKEEIAKLAELQEKKELDEAETKELADLEAKAAEAEKAERTADFEKTISEIVEKKTLELGEKIEVSVEKLMIPHSKGEKDVDMNEVTHKCILAMHNSNKDLSNEMKEKAMVEGTTTAGGYFVPEVFVNDVIRLAEEYGDVRRLCSVFQQPTDSTKLPTETTTVAVSEKAENTAFAQTQPVIGQLELIPYKVGAITPFSNELLMDSGVALIPYLKKILAEQIAKHEDTAVLVGGDGYSQTDILNNGTAVTMGAGDTAVSDLDGDDLLDLIYSVEKADRKGAAFIMDSTVFAVVQKLKDSNGDYIFKHLAEKGPGTIHGYPVIINDVMPDADVGADAEFMIFGNLKNYLYGVRENITFDFSMEATLTTTGNLFEKDLIAIRIKERFSGTPARDGAFSVLKTHA